MTGFIVWSVLLGLVALVWASRHLDISRAQREQLVLSSTSFAGPPTEPPRVSFLIAAKDEEANIETAVRTVLAQDYPDLEVIVINDRSDDRTGEILDAIKEEHPSDRFRVVHVRELRDGWFGKNNAMREGLERAGGAWFCFGDADCRQTSTQSVSMAVRHALEQEVDFLSVLPRLEAHSLWERIIQPVCGAIMVFWFHPRKVNDPAHPAAYANGAFMLMKRSCYEAIGGHDAVRTEVNEDMHMARRAKQCGQRLAVIQNDDLYTVRMYARFREIWYGWSRIFYGCFGTMVKLTRTLAMLLVTNMFPYVSAGVALTALAVGGGSAVQAGWGWPAVTSGLAIVLQQTVLVRFYRISHASPWLAPTWIIGAVICVAMLANAMLKLGGRTTTTWRGTTYRGHEVSSPSS